MENFKFELIIITLKIEETLQFLRRQAIRLVFFYSYQIQIENPQQFATLRIH